MFKFFYIYITIKKLLSALQSYFLKREKNAFWYETEIFLQRYNHNKKFRTHIYSKQSLLYFENDFLFSKVQRKNFKSL